MDYVVFQDIPIDVVQTIGLLTHSTKTYLNLALSCKQNSKILTNVGKRLKAQRLFTTITTDEYDVKRWKINGKEHRENGPAVISNGNNQSGYLRISSKAAAGSVKI